MSDHIGPDRHAELMELLRDADACLRLSAWEEDFLCSIHEKMDTYGERAILSDKQEEVLERIEKKVYAI